MATKKLLPFIKTAVCAFFQKNDLFAPSKKSKKLSFTGSGKTGAFALPMLQSLLENPQRLFGLVLTPTRELAFQIAEQFEALGKSIGIKCGVLVGEKKTGVNCRASRWGTCPLAF